MKDQPSSTVTKLTFQVTSQSQPSPESVPVLRAAETLPRARNGNRWISGEGPTSLPHSSLAATTLSLPRDLRSVVHLSEWTSKPFTDKNEGYPRTGFLVCIHRITLGQSNRRSWKQEQASYFLRSLGILKSQNESKVWGKSHSHSEMWQRCVSLWLIPVYAVFFNPVGQMVVKKQWIIITGTTKTTNIYIVFTTL